MKERDERDSGGSVHGARRTRARLTDGRKSSQSYLQDDVWCMYLDVPCYPIHAGARVKPVSSTFHWANVRLKRPSYYQVRYQDGCSRDEAASIRHLSISIYLTVG